MINNYYKIVIPLINKTYFKFNENKKGTSYKYSGNAYILIEKETNCIAFNTLLLDDGEVWGADDGRYGKDYGIKRLPDLFEIRKKSFNTSTKKTGNKTSSKLRISNEELNKQILKNKLTIKSVDGFITGSNASGGLEKPSNDPVTIHYKNEDLIEKIFNGDVINGNKTWKIFSLFSNLTCVLRNNVFPDEVTIDYLNKIEEKNIEYIFDLDWEVVPYGLRDEEDSYVEFKKAFVSQNIENFKDKLKVPELLTLSSKNWRNADHVEIIMKMVDDGNRKFLAKQLRGNWRKIIDEAISKYKFEKDFVKGFSIYDKAHILENADVVKYILSNEIEKHNKEKLLKDLFDKDNFILLDKNTHKLWDDGLIKIDNQGNIINISLEKMEFDIMFKDSRDIFHIYPNILNGNRSYLINKRNERRKSQSIS